jgi:Protein of unknown function (DUF2855)
VPETVHVNKADLGETRIADIGLPPLAANAVRLRVESFAVTANNVTYAVIGDMFGYWQFFPAPDGWGVVPMWGHAVVEASNHADIGVGERVYGYLPIGTHLDVLPGKVADGQFMDMTDYRQPMSIFYNQYSRLAADPEHDPAREDARMLFGPLFKTGFLIEAMFVREGWYGAEALVMTSASSKTAMALASVAKATSPQIRRIGLTSPGNLDFVEGTGLYDEVIAYGDLSALPLVRSVSVDFAGNAGVLRAVHTVLDGQLAYSCTVGFTHIGARPASGDPLPGPAPILFFAPDHATATVKALGPQGFAEAVAARWREFVTATDKFMAVNHRQGVEAARDAYLATMAGTADPAVGIVVRP